MPAAENKSESVVRVADLVKEFGPLRVLDGVGFDVKPGQTVAIVGRSGSGKSTLLRCIAGLETIQAGTIEVCGHPVGRPGSAARAAWILSKSRASSKMLSLTRALTRSQVEVSSEERRGDPPSEPEYFWTCLKS